MSKSSELSPLQRSVLVIEGLKNKIKILENAQTEAIAIVGMACRFPGGANTPEAFWHLLSEGVDGISELKGDRWQVNDYYDPKPGTPGKMYTREAGCVDNIDQFDPQFFNISPREAMTIDPQHRLLLEVSWEALEQSGNIPDRVQGSPTGVFVGISATEYSWIAKQSNADLSMGAYAVTGLPLYGAAGRLSYTFGLTGPSMAIDTACSSSLVALHQACNSLRQKECDMALAGGVNLFLLPNGFIWLSQAQMSSPDGRCKTFDERADGAGWGSGCGMLVLKRLSDALDSRDNILATIRGSAVNQDGPTSGFTVPNSASQQQVIRQALRNAQLNPSQVSYIEAHGTGTPLGDPIELRSLAEVFAQDGARKEPLAIASVKTNIGHLASAAGISGVMKAILQLQHQQIAPHLHLKQPTSKFNWQETSFYIPTQLTPWEVKEGTRIAGVSSFGASGTNAHILLEEAPLASPSEAEFERPYHLFTLSAKTEKALSELIERYSTHLETHQDLKLADICFTTNTGRSHFNHRLALLAQDRQELLDRLQSSEQNRWSGYLENEAKTPKIAFLFTGQGSQYLNMGKELYETQPIFRQALEQCEAILRSELDWSLLEILYPQTSDSDSTLDQTAYTQPTLFALEYALVQLWKSWGIKPNWVMGHSVGEYVAATVAGVFSLEDGLKLIAARGKLMQNLPGEGTMAAVMASEETVQAAIASDPTISLAAINGPTSVVISGARNAITHWCNQLESQGIKTKSLNVSHGFHSQLMEPILAEFEAIANSITYHVPKIPLISNLSGTRADSSIATARYWVNHIRQPVRFAPSMETLHQEGCKIFLEIGPKPILLGMGRYCISEPEILWLPSLHPAIQDWQQILSSLSQLYITGIKVDWNGCDRPYTRQKSILPTYPFQHQPYWVEISELAEKGSSDIMHNYYVRLAIHAFENGQLQEFQHHLEQVENMSNLELKAFLNNQSQSPIFASLLAGDWEKVSEISTQVERMSEEEIKSTIR